MKPAAATYDALLARITTWAMNEPNVRALTIIGSRARQQDPADEWSDVDLVLLARRPAVYLADGQWLREFGSVWLNHVERAPVGGVPEHRAVFDGALEVDFVILPSRGARLARLGLHFLSRFPAAARLLSPGLRGRLSGLPETFGRGFRTLVDKDGLMPSLPLTALSTRPRTKPSQEQFLATIDRLWHGSIWVAKHLRRGELWRAKDGCDARMKTSILQLAEWHAKAAKGWDLDTWDQGRFIERWADPRVVTALAGAFGHYDTEDVWRALLATMALCRWLGRETAAGLGVAYPTVAETRATEWVSRCFDERKAMSNLRSGTA